MEKEIMNIPAEKFTFTNTNTNLHDKELVTKPVSYFKDAWNRFKRNKASILAAIIILILMLFAAFGPLISPFTVAYEDPYYAYALPKLQICEDLDLGILDGYSEKTVNESSFFFEYAKGVETGHNSIRNQKYEIVDDVDVKGNPIKKYVIDYNSYNTTGMIYMNFKLEDFKAIQAYQDANNVQIIYPMTDADKLPKTGAFSDNANVWYATKKSGQIYLPKNHKVNEDGTITYSNVYLTCSPTVSDEYTSTVMTKEELEAGHRMYRYYTLKGNPGTSDAYYRCRVLYYEYYKYYHKEVLKDGIKEPSFILGSDNAGKDIFVNLSGGARFSFIFAIVVALVNLFVGAIYGAIEGYYGGKIDLFMERFVEILSSVPFMIVITLLKYHMVGSSQLLILFIAFFLTGWIGMAGRTRMQFYRFKNQEYVLAARTLGAKDTRIMFKHIFPNSLGTLITSCVLVIPGMIFSETSLSYLGIINLSTGSLTSVGTLLAKGQSYLVQAPHIVLFPSLFISLLMLSFNLFGNGLRDAFNPSLRGSE